MTWYLVRSSGMAAYAVLAASMLWGLWLSTRAPSPPGRAWTLEVHKALGGVAVLATIGHLGALLADSYVAFDVVDLFVPFASDWNPTAVAWGVIAAWLLAAVQVTALLRRTLTKRSWRRVHLASFGAYLLATAHFLTAGTDAGSRPVLALVLGSFAVIALATVHRATQHLSRPVPPKETPPWNRTTTPPRIPVAATTAPPRPLTLPMTVPATRPVTLSAGPPSASPAGPPPSAPPPPWPPAS